MGPALARTALPLDAFLQQVRRPRGIMPAFPPEAVSDADLQAIYAYLQQVPPAPPRLRADLPRGELARESCTPCHRTIHATIVRQFEASAMGRAARQNPRVVYPLVQIGCADCHGTNHDRIMSSKGRVPETTCAGCHAEIYKEHVLDAGHSYGPGPGKLGINWERNIGMPHYREMPRKVMEMGCDPCHAQVGATDAKYWRGCIATA